jgi:hypothetical protein
VLTVLQADAAANREPHFTRRLMLRYCAAQAELGHEQVATLSDATAVLHHCGAAVRTAVAHAAICAQRADTPPRPSPCSERAFAATLLACAIAAEPADRARPLPSSIDDAWVRRRLSPFAFPR